MDNIDKVMIGLVITGLAIGVGIFLIPIETFVEAASYPDIESRLDIYWKDFPQYKEYYEPYRDTQRQEFCKFNGEQCFPEPVQSAMYSQLDAMYPMPKDFVHIKDMRARGIVPYSSELITEDYWMQPEWESSYRLGVRTMKGYSRGTYSALCFHNFPSPRVFEITVPKDRSELEIEDIAAPIWVRSSWKTDRYQAFKIAYVYPETDYFEGSAGVPYKPFTVVQDPNIASEYIDIHVDREGNTLIGPNFPVFHVADNPQYKLQLMATISIDPYIPVGDYVVGFDYGPPSDEPIYGISLNGRPIADLTFSEMNSLKYGYKYADKSFPITKCDLRGFRAFIKVTEQ